MEKIAIYGKGGIGKSVISTNLSAYYGKIGKKVLHIGCDPKHDSSLKLLNFPNIKTVLDILKNNPDNITSELIINKGKFNIHCIEAGGPEPGVGCGGRGVAKTIEIIDEAEILNDKSYDMVIFDVLGDVVCGGFAAPLRLGMAEKIFIIISEEPMALFAANNIAKAIKTYHQNNVVLGGFIANLRSDSADISLIENFSKKLNTKIVSIINRDNFIIQSERKRMTVIENDFDSDISKKFALLGNNILKMESTNIPLPTPMTDEEFFDFIKV